MGGAAFPALHPQPVEDLVGADGIVLLPDDLEDAPAQRRETQVALRANPLRGGERVVDAEGMIVPAGLECVR